MAFDFKRAYKEFYITKNRPEFIDDLKENYIAVRDCVVCSENEL